ncbi:MAG: lipoyl(octanoyl) transferase LipB [Thermodesulfobacteriota bacterium]
MPAKNCYATDLGLISVSNAERLMEAVTKRRVREELPDIVLFLAHPKTVAVGLRGGPPERHPDLLVSPRRLEEEGISLARSIRGGGITYHWSGQVVCYPLFALGPRERNISQYMRNLEEVAIRCLDRFGIRAERKRTSAAHIGLWAQDRKVVSMGVRVSSWITSFGFALNLEGDLEPSRYVRPCGLEQVRLTTVEEILGRAPSRKWVVEVLQREFGSVFGRKLCRMPDRLTHEIWSLDRPEDRAMAGSAWM